MRISASNEHEREVGKFELLTTSMYFNNIIGRSYDMNPMNNKYSYHVIKAILISYLERGRNIEPSMKTEPDSRMYQLLASSPVLENNNIYVKYEIFFLIV